MKMFGQWLGLDKVASCQMCPRKSPLGQFPPPPWLLSDFATMTSDISSVFDVPSVICDERGLIRNELVPDGLGSDEQPKMPRPGPTMPGPPKVRLP